MEKQIENIHELRSEIARLRIVAKQQEGQIKDDLKEIREDLKPANLLWNSVSSITGINVSKDEFFKNGIAYGVSLIIQRFILKSEKKIEDRVYNFVDTIVDRVKGFTDRFTGQGAKRAEREEEREEF